MLASAVFAACTVSALSSFADHVVASAEATLLVLCVIFELVVEYIAITVALMVLIASFVVLPTPTAIGLVIIVTAFVASVVTPSSYRDQRAKRARKVIHPRTRRVYRPRSLRQRRRSSLRRGKLVALLRFEHKTTAHAIQDAHTQTPAQPSPPQLQVAAPKSPAPTPSPSHSIPGYERHISRIQSAKLRRRQSTSTTSPKPTFKSTVLYPLATSPDYKYTLDVAKHVRYHGKNARRRSPIAYPSSPASVSSVSIASTTSAASQTETPASPRVRHTSTTTERPKTCDATTQARTTTSQCDATTQARTTTSQCDATTQARTTTSQCDATTSSIFASIEQQAPLVPQPRPSLQPQVLFPESAVIDIKTPPPQVEFCAQSQLMDPEIDALMDIAINDLMDIEFDDVQTMEPFNTVQTTEPPGAAFQDPWENEEFVSSDVIPTLLSTEPTWDVLEPVDSPTSTDSDPFSFLADDTRDSIESFTSHVAPASIGPISPVDDIPVCAHEVVIDEFIPPGAREVVIDEFIPNKSHATPTDATEVNPVSAHCVREGGASHVQDKVSGLGGPATSIERAPRAPLQELSSTHQRLVPNTSGDATTRPTSSDPIPQTPSRDVPSPQSRRAAPPTYRTIEGLIIPASFAETIIKDFGEMPRFVSNFNPSEEELAMQDHDMLENYFGGADGPPLPFPLMA